MVEPTDEFAVVESTAKDGLDPGSDVEKFEELMVEFKPLTKLAKEVVVGKVEQYGCGTS